MPTNVNKYISRVAKIVDELSGSSAKEWKVRSEILSHAKAEGLTPLRASRIAKQKAAESMRTRVKGGAAAVGAYGAGMLGMHKYHQHQDNKVLAKLNEMYKIPGSHYNTDY